MRKLLNICLLVYLLALPAMAGAQNDSVLLGVGAPLRPADSSALVSPLHSVTKKILPDSLHHTPDSLLAIADTLDSLSRSSSLPPLLPSPNALTAIVHYKATDSIAIDINKRKAQLFSKGSIEYDGMELKADDIRVDFDKQILSARPVTDTAGKVNGRPFFKQGEA